jgi:hypothetical protein
MDPLHGHQQICGKSKAGENDENSEGKRKSCGRSRVELED